MFRFWCIWFFSLAIFLSFFVCTEFFLNAIFGIVWFHLKFVTFLGELCYWIANILKPQNNIHFASISQICIVNWFALNFLQWHLPIGLLMVFPLLCAFSGFSFSFSVCHFIFWNDFLFYLDRCPFLRYFRVIYSQFCIHKTDKCKHIEQKLSAKGMKIDVISLFLSHSIHHFI